MTQADHAVALIKKLGSARSPAIEEALGIKSVAAVLAPKVADGTLVMCKVERPGLRSCNEYRLSVAGGGRTTGFSDMSAPGVAGRGLEAARAAQETARALKKPAGANGHDRDQAKPPAPAAPEPKTPRIGAIEKGIPIPVRNNHGEIRGALAEMEPGDSRLVSFTKQAIQYAAKQLKVRVTIAKEGEAGDHRVWLVGPKEQSQ